MINQPYIGLRPFERDEKDIFFGREQHADELIDFLGSNHFLAVVGTSGCGKSSLVKTGLIAGLEAGYLAQASTHWRIVEMRPGNQPFKALADNLFNELEDVLSSEYSAETLQQALRQGSLSLHKLLIKHPLPNNAQLLIVCDQFEEIFRYFKQGESAEASLFVSFLLASSQAYPVAKDHASHPIYVVITMRSDYLGDCAQFEGLAEAINQGLYLTPRLNPQQLRAAIEEPAFMFDGEVEPELVVKLLEDVGNNPDQLPLLQHILMRLWDLSENKRLTLAEYENLGGLVRTGSPSKDCQSLSSSDNDNALSRHADEVLQELNAVQQVIAKQIFCRLTNSEADKKDTRNPAKVKDLLALTGLMLEQLADVLKPFRQAGRCFLMPTETVPLTEDSMIDISHESLIRQWQTLQHWVTEEAQAAQTYRHLLEGALRYRNKQVGVLQEPELSLMVRWQKDFQPTAAWARRYGKHEEDFPRALAFLSKSAKWRRIKRIFYTVLVVTMTVLAGFATWQWKIAEKHKKQAQEQQQLAQKQKDLALQQKQLAMEVISQFTYEVPKALANIPQTGKLTAEILEFNIQKLDEIYALNPSDKKTQIMKADNYEKIASLWLSLLNNGQKALFYHLKSYTLRLSLTKNGDAAMLNEKLSSNLKNLGDTYFKLDQLDNALHSYQQYHEIAKKIAQRDAKNSQAQIELSISYLKLGNISLRRELPNEALSYYQQALKIKEEVFKQNKDNDTKVSLMVGLGKVGNTYLKLKQVDKALEYYEQALKGFKEIAKQKPYNDIEAQRDVYVSYQKLGKAYSEYNQNEKSLKNYKESFLIILKLSDIYKDDNSLKEDLMEAYQYLADIYLKLNYIQESKENYVEAFKIAQKLYGDDPDNNNVKYKLSKILKGLAEIDRKLKEKRHVSEFVEKASSIAKKLDEDKIYQAQQDLNTIKRLLDGQD